MCVNYKLCVKLHKGPFAFNMEKFPSLENFYTHAVTGVTDNYQVCFAIVFGFLCDFLDFSYHCTVAVTRPERPKGVKDVAVPHLLESGLVKLTNYHPLPKVKTNVERTPFHLLWIPKTYEN